VKYVHTADETTKLVSPQCIENHWKLSVTVANSVDTTDADETRQSRLVSSVSVVWSRFKATVVISHALPRFAAYDNARLKRAKDAVVYQLVQYCLQCAYEICCVLYDFELTLTSVTSRHAAERLPCHCCRQPGQRTGADSGRGRSRARWTGWDHPIAYTYIIIGFVLLWYVVWYRTACCRRLLNKLCIM